MVQVFSIIFALLLAANLCSATPIPASGLTPATLEKEIEALQEQKAVHGRGPGGVLPRQVDEESLIEEERKEEIEILQEQKAAYGGGPVSVLARQLDEE
jgi:hypothetical protein